MTSVTSMMRNVWPNAVAALAAAPARSPRPSAVDTAPNATGANPVDIDTSALRTASAVPHSRECTMSSLAALSGGFTPPIAIPARNANASASGRLSVSSVGRMNTAAARNVTPPTTIRALMWPQPVGDASGAEHADQRADAEDGDEHGRLGLADLKPATQQGHPEGA